MLYTELTKKALRVCYEAHSGQMDKGGVPYVFHPLYVAGQMQDEYDICVALLHDVIEDSDYTMEDIISMGFPGQIIDAIRCITKLKSQSYEEYIQAVKTNPIAVRVKLADLEHNSDLTRLSKVDEAALERLRKYEAAKKELMR